MQRIVIGILEKVEEGERKFLLVSSVRDYGEHSGKWYPPGGKVEEGESDEEALIREMREELGLEVKVTGLISDTEGDFEGLEVAWMKCECIDPQCSIVDGNVKEFGWFSEAELRGLELWPATRSFFESYLVSGSPCLPAGRRLRGDDKAFR